MTKGPESWTTTYGDKASVYAGNRMGCTGDWYWHRMSANGNVVADGGQGYARRIDCLRMAERINPRVES